MSKFGDSIPHRKKRNETPIETEIGEASPRNQKRDWKTNLDDSSRQITVGHYHLSIELRELGFLKGAADDNREQLRRRLSNLTMILIRFPFSIFKILLWTNEDNNISIR